MPLFDPADIVQDAYFKIKHTLDEINAILDVASPSGSNKLRVAPELGNVLFGCPLMGWSFTLESFAKLYADTYGSRAEIYPIRLY
jgi:U5 small nuclear ribonucleoprotein component